MTAHATASPAAPARHHRRTYLIDRGFQLKYMLTLGALGGLMSGLFGAMMYLTHVEAMADALPGAQHGLATAANGTMVLLTVAMAVLMALAFGLVGLLITHRVAGPIYVMSHYMSLMVQGRYPKMRKLRKADELKAFFERFQSAVEVLWAREVDEVSTLESALQALTPLATSEEARASIETVQLLVRRKREATDRVGSGPPKAPLA